MNEKTGKGESDSSTEGSVKIEGLELFLKFKLSLARALSFGTSLELEALKRGKIPNLPLLRLLLFKDLTTNV